MRELCLRRHLHPIPLPQRIDMATSETGHRQHAAATPASGATSETRIDTAHQPVETQGLAVAIERESDGGAGFLDAQNGGIGALGAGDGVGADLIIVLLPDPALEQMSGAASRRGSASAMAGRFHSAGGLAGESAARCAADHRAALHRPTRARDFGDHLAVMAHAQPAIAGDFADLDSFQTHLRNTWKTSCSRPLAATSSMRSCDSESMMS